ncbi:MAG TPA: hypothetical protein VLU94_02305 [Candidatus Nitrosotalea sp.]|nr:hypothetical protein [Candidatus Nitrosotalea sp.]
MKKHLSPLQLGWFDLDLTPPWSRICQADANLRLATIATGW